MDGGDRWPCNQQIDEQLNSGEISEIPNPCFEFYLLDRAIASAVNNTMYRHFHANKSTSVTTWSL